jgi:hypothetical protein
MKKGGLADSPFFTQPLPTAASAPVPEKGADNPQATPRPKAKQPTHHATVIPRHHDTRRDTMTPRDHDAMIEAVRKAVREFGKEAATHRFTLDEKKAIADIIYSYKGQRIKTSENEIARIAVNFIVSDYEQHSEDSVLHQVIQALHR